MFSQQCLNLFQVFNQKQLHQITIWCRFPLEVLTEDCITTEDFQMKYLSDPLHQQRMFLLSYQNREIDLMPQMPNKRFKFLLPPECNPILLDCLSFAS